MEYNKNIFICGKNVNLDFGTVRFLTFEEFIFNQEVLSVVALNNLHIYYHYYNYLKNKPQEELDELKKLKDISLYEIIVSDSYFLEIYIKIIELLVTFNEGYSVADIFSNKDTFDIFRKIIMDMNLIKEEKVFYDERLQHGQEMSKKISSVHSDKQTFEDIITTIVATTSKSIQEILSMTVYQVYAIFARVSAIFNYQTTTLFATVSSDVKIENWSKHIDLLAPPQTTDLRRSEFEKRFGEAF